MKCDVDPCLIEDAPRATESTKQLDIPCSVSVLTSQQTMITLFSACEVESSPLFRKGRSLLAPKYLRLNERDGTWHAIRLCSIIIETSSIPSSFHWRMVFLFSFSSFIGINYDHTVQLFESTLSDAIVSSLTIRSCPEGESSNRRIILDIYTRTMLVFLRMTVTKVVARPWWIFFVVLIIFCIVTPFSLSMFISREWSVSHNRLARRCVNSPYID